LAFVLFAFITAAVIASIVIPCVIISGVLIARRVTAIIVVYVLAFVVGRDFHAVVIVGSDFFAGVCISFHVGSGPVRQLRSARYIQVAE
jgi:hypothetical protein